MYFLLLLLSCNSKWERPTRQSLRFIPSFLSALQPAKSQQLGKANTSKLTFHTFLFECVTACEKSTTERQCESSRIASSAGRPRETSAFRSPASGSLSLSTARSVSHVQKPA